MNILNIEHISKIYGEKVIFDDVSLGIHSGDKIGVIGVNGTGKTTLLKIIAKINEPDKGQIIYGNGIRVSYLPQNPEFPKKQSILEYVIMSTTTISNETRIGIAFCVVATCGIIGIMTFWFSRYSGTYTE